MLPTAPPQTRVTAPSAPMLMVMSGVPGIFRPASAVACKSSAASAAVRGITASLAMSAPAMAVRVSTISSSGGVPSKWWRLYTVRTPAAFASAKSCRPGSPALYSTSSRSAPPAASTARHSAA